ncbi:MAG: flagellin [Sneathiella sp.]|jgi:flagellin|uniref:flagellin n=1 Tax=Sneathiella sp. TaxID=1964365 RepID=UPI000C54CA7B|nr:flagellin [Sneathiella sp.]MAL80609.1 flagellin [Sneathiella sp.]|tara:strand:- start:666 stop:1466 length:801 start_codon:yes stop_codon:yes gene_type:complete
MAAFSINTNATAMAALRTLTTTQSALGQTQRQVETGLKVAEPKDNPASFTISQAMRGDIAAMDAIEEALTFGQATVAMANAGALKISNILIDINQKVTQAFNDGLDTAVLQEEVDSLLADITTTVNSTVFNGVNLIDGVSPDLEVLTGLGGVSQTINIQDLRLATLGLGTLDLTDPAASLTALEAAETMVGNVLTTLGTAANRLDRQAEFSQLLTDKLKEGLGILVDANLAEASAEMQALQTKEQLGIQSLSIANARPQSILQLFK